MEVLFCFVLFFFFGFGAACGHISCFWCVHKSMNGLQDSHCPICRNPYSHFPTICQMLHFLLKKMYPLAYKRRELQILGQFCYILFVLSQFFVESINCLGLGNRVGNFMSLTWLLICYFIWFSILLFCVQCRRGKGNWALLSAD